MELTELIEKMKIVLEVTELKEFKDKLLDIVLNNKISFYEKYVETIKELEIDYLQPIFQYWFADRKEKMQDFTPVSLVELVSALTNNTDNIIDMCCGTGALTIGAWKNWDSRNFELIEFDEDVIPFTLFNMCVRNMSGTLIHMNVITNEIFGAYTIKKGLKFSEVKKGFEFSEKRCLKTAISNPPYNVKWEHTPLTQLEPRFKYGVPGEKRADWVFALSALEKADRVVMILPMGALKGQNNDEKKMIETLIKKNLIETVIQNPVEMFESTNVATCIIVLNKHKTTSNVMLIDAQKEYEVVERTQRGQFGGKSHTNRVYTKKVNVYSEENINKIILSANNKKEIDDFSMLVSNNVILQNNCKLNLTAYISVKIDRTIHREIQAIVEDYNRIVRRKNAIKLTINEKLARQIGLLEVWKDYQSSPNLEELEKLFGVKLEKDKWLSVTKNKNEFKIENTDKEILPEMLLMTINTWKTIIMMLNNDCNRLLVELRDVAMQGLLTGYYTAKNETE